MTLDYIPADEQIIIARKEAIQAEQNKKHFGKRWPADETKLITSLIRKHYAEMTNQQVAELYLREFLLRSVDWSPSHAVVINKIQNVKQKLGGST
ncbi:hypothetical protein HK097_002162 [Rhizophlyctis rosea]|uniref:Uncharacterized protein n=1 Tax=Rhizophlyctis rosea TaxID=64517 RepID=A0AAD5S4M5_9FUNG|nr:hypothetical protein HK097_002162 [Rhizophlyctis rosea]